MMKTRYSRWRIVLMGALRFLVVTLSVFIMCYIVFALFFSTDEERRLQRENSLYRSRYSRL